MNNVLHKQAFTLIELLVYTVLFSFFSLVAFGFFNSVYVFLSQSCSQSARTIKNALALDMIRKDLMSACPDSAMWGEGACIFCLEQIDATGSPVTSHVGWEVYTGGHKKIALRRSEGVYDFSERKWVKRSSSYFGCGITALQIKLAFAGLRHGRLASAQVVARVRVIYVADGKELDEIVVLRNRWFDTSSIRIASAGHSP